MKQDKTFLTFLDLIEKDKKNKKVYAGDWFKTYIGSFIEIVDDNHLNVYGCVEEEYGRIVWTITEGVTHNGKLVKDLVKLNPEEILQLKKELMLHKLYGGY